MPAPLCLPNPAAPAASRPLDHLVLRGEPHAPALRLGDAIIDYASLSERVAGLSGWLTTLRPAPGARVASWLAKDALAALLPLATARAGLVHVPLNPLLKRGQVAHILADSGASALITTPARAGTLAAGDVPGACQLIMAETALAGGRDAAPLGPSSAHPDALAALFYTSGSTGRPKGVMLSHANLWLGTESVATYLALSPEDRVLAVLPLAFDYGQNQLLASWYAGASVAMLDYLTPRDVIQTAAHHRITTLAAVPPLWQSLVEADWPTAVAAGLRRLTNSGGALTVPLVRALRARFPAAALYAMYGLTEAFRGTYLDPALVDTHPTAVGTAIPHAEVMVVRDDGSVADANEEGEIVQAGPLVAQGYWRDAARTAERFRPAPAAARYGGMAVWSGDRGWVDGEGLLHVAGRRDALIKSLGHRISPEEIEAAALATGLVAEAVALGLLDPRFGQAVHLVVRGVSTDPAQQATAQAMLPKLLARDLPGFMLPRGVHWRDHLPTGVNGKLDRAALLAELSASMGAKMGEGAS